MEDNNETNPEIVHMLDQNAAEFNNKKDEFEATYGFEHTCVCDTDYTSGRVGEVTFCYAGLLTDALDACERLNADNKRLEALLDEAMQLIDAAQPIVAEYEAKEKELDAAAEGDDN